MTYYVLFPTLIFAALLKAQVDMQLLGNIVIIVLVPTILFGLLQWMGFLSPSLKGPTLTSMFQGAVRNNTAVSLVIAAWLVPDKGIAIMAVIMLIMIPTVNLMSIFVLLKYGEEVGSKQVSFVEEFFQIL